MRLLRAELRKFRRPLAVWTVIAVVVLIGLFAWGARKGAVDQLRFAQDISGAAPPCEVLGLQPGTECDRRLDQIRKDGQRAAALQLRDIRTAAETLSPLGAGAFAAGMMASLLGAVVLLLLAGGHVGQEWSGRTIKQVLVQEGRRWRILLAKWASLFVAGMVALLVIWVALAILSPILSAAYPLHVGVRSGAAFARSLTEIVRASLVVLTFAALGVLCAVITRNTLGAFFLGFAFVVASLILGGFRSVGRFTLAYWVTGWMRFGQHGPLQSHIWRDAFYPLKNPGIAAGLAGLSALIAFCAVLAWVRFERSDIKV
jgi:ABC-type transport system involved in multi-copper enzyme maturation permease subunit